MQRRNKRIAMIIAIILVAALVLPIVITALIPDAQAAVSQKDINDKKKEIENLRAEKLKTQNLIKQKKGQRDDIIQIKTLYDDEIAMVELEIELTTELISDINAAIAERQQELDEARAREADLAEQYINRVRAMESMGNISYLGILLQAESLTAFLTNWDIVQEIMKRDKKLADELLAERTMIEETIEELEKDKQEMYDRRRDLAEKQAELAALSAEAQDTMNEYIAEMAKLMADEKRLADAEAKATKEEDDMKKEWERIQEELRKRNNSQFVGGEYLWPVPGYEGKISSGYGIRVHPIYKVKKHHSGIDIPAPKGTPIAASNAGEIIIRTKASGYGNYVVIDHGGGQSTLYAHMDKFSGLQVGSKVKTGEIIGYVGSTGLSTGNHLHFEIRINGNDIDPVPKLKR